MTGYRLPSGGRIDRNQPVAFKWAGRSISGYAGDTLASALLANGIDIIGRSFKYHRPRGLIAAGLEEPNAIVQVLEGPSSRPNYKATQISLYDGLAAEPVNAWPNAEFDLMSVIGLFKRFIPAAFYYKTFMWPNWHLFEGPIRRAAGLGKAPRDIDPDRYAHRNHHVEILIIGSGSAGLWAALEAGRAGKEVMLVEADGELGGWNLSENGAAIDQITDELYALPNVQILTRTLAFGYYDHNLIGLCERLTDHLPVRERSGIRERLWKVRAEEVCLATGAFERPLAFRNNDRPGIMLASAAQTYCVRYGVAVGRRIVVVTNNDSAYHAAFALHDAGIEIAAIIDSRSSPDFKILAEADARNISVKPSTIAHSAIGKNRVKCLETKSIRDGRVAAIACDTILVSGGWNPAVHLHSQSGGQLEYDEALQTFIPTSTLQNATSTGSAAGDELAKIIPAPQPNYEDGSPDAHKAWLDFQNDVTVGDVQLAARENFRSVEHVKRYTTLGMASDQGKTSNVSAIQVMAHLLDKPPAAIGTTKFRPPFDPVTIGAFAGHMVGENLMPSAYPAMYEAHLALGAKNEEYGYWIRPAYYPAGGETECEAVAREVRATRNAIGIFDASPLGKIEVKGPDAAEFLDRMFINNIRSLRIENCRYCVMLNENGTVYDDGIVARMAEDHFLVGTTSGHAEAIADIFEEWLQCEWPDLNVLTCNVSTGWAVINIAGPRSRELFSAVGTDIALSAEQFPHMQYRQGTVAGLNARVQRVSFNGELSFEISVPWRHGPQLWDALMVLGEPFGITPIGVEALMAMRIEKGFFHVGSDTEGTTQPHDLGFDHIIAKKKTDFVGRRSIMRPDSLRANRRQLVGLDVTDDQGPLVVGSHILPHDATEANITQGYVTSACDSIALGQPVALGLVEAGRSRIGESVRIWNMGHWRSAKIALPGKYDPEGARLHV